VDWFWNWTARSLTVNVKPAFTGSLTVTAPEKTEERPSVSVTVSETV
jgi:hypothetical protein